MPQLLCSQQVRLWHDLSETSATSLSSSDSRMTPPEIIQRTSISTFTDRCKSNNKELRYLLTILCFLQLCTDGNVVVAVESLHMNVTEAMFSLRQASPFRLTKQLMPKPRGLLRALPPPYSGPHCRPRGVGVLVYHTISVFEGR